MFAWTLRKKVPFPLVRAQSLRAPLVQERARGHRVHEGSRARPPPPTHPHPPPPSFLFNSCLLVVDGSLVTSGLLAKHAGIARGALAFSALTLCIAVDAARTAVDGPVLIG